MSFCLFYIQQACLKQIENQKRRRLAMQCTGVPVVVPLVVHLCITSSVVHQLFSSLLREFLFCATVFRPCSWRGKSATHQQFCCESPQRYNVNEKKSFVCFQSVKTSKNPSKNPVYLSQLFLSLDGVIYSQCSTGCLFTITQWVRMGKKGLIFLTLV